MDDKKGKNPSGGDKAPRPAAGKRSTLLEKFGGKRSSEVLTKPRGRPANINLPGPMGTSPITDPNQSGLLSSVSSTFGAFFGGRSRRATRIDSPNNSMATIPEHGLPSSSPRLLQRRTTFTPGTPGSAGDPLAGYASITQLRKGYENAKRMADFYAENFRKVKKDLEKERAATSRLTIDKERDELLHDRRIKELEGERDEALAAVTKTPVASPPSQAQAGLLSPTSTLVPSGSAASVSEADAVDNTSTAARIKFLMKRIERQDMRLEETERELRDTKEDLMAKKRALESAVESAQLAEILFTKEKTKIESIGTNLQDLRSDSDTVVQKRPQSAGLHGHFWGSMVFENSSDAAQTATPGERRNTAVRDPRQLLASMVGSSATTNQGRAAPAGLVGITRAHGHGQSVPSTPMQPVAGPSAPANDGSETARGNYMTGGEYDLVALEHVSIEDYEHLLHEYRCLSLAMDQLGRRLQSEGSIMDMAEQGQTIMAQEEEDLLEIIKDETWIPYTVARCYNPETDDDFEEKHPIPRIQKARWQQQTADAALQDFGDSIPSSPSSVGEMMTGAESDDLGDGKEDTEDESQEETEDDTDTSSDHFTTETGSESSYNTDASSITDAGRDVSTLMALSSAIVQCTRLRDKETIRLRGLERTKTATGIRVDRIQRHIYALKASDDKIETRNNALAERKDTAERLRLLLNEAGTLHDDFKTKADIAQRWSDTRIASDKELESVRSLLEIRQREEKPEGGDASAALPGSLMELKEKEEQWLLTREEANKELDDFVKYMALLANREGLRVHLVSVQVEADSDMAALTTEVNAAFAAWADEIRQSAEDAELRINRAQQEVAAAIREYQEEESRTRETLTQHQQATGLNEVYERAVGDSQRLHAEMATSREELRRVTDEEKEALDVAMKNFFTVCEKIAFYMESIAKKNNELQEGELTSKQRKKSTKTKEKIERDLDESLSRQRSVRDEVSRLFYSRQEHLRQLGETATARERQLQDQITEMLASASNEQQAAQRSIGVLNSRLAELESQRDSAFKEHQEAEQRARSQADENHRNLAQSRSEVQRLRQQLTESEQVTRDERARHQAAIESLGSAPERVQQMEAAMEAMEQADQHLREQLRTEEERNKALSAQLAQLQRENEQRKREVEEEAEGQNREIDRLKDELNVLRWEASKLRLQVAVLQNDKGETSGDGDDDDVEDEDEVPARRGASDIHIDTLLKMNLKGLIGELEKAIKERDEARGEIEMLERCNADLAEDLEKLEGQLGDIQSDEDGLRNETRETNDRWQQALEDVKQKEWELAEKKEEIRMLRDRMGAVAVDPTVATEELGMSVEQREEAATSASEEYTTVLSRMASIGITSTQNDDDHTNEQRRTPQPDDTIVNDGNPDSDHSGETLASPARSSVGSQPEGQISPSGTRSPTYSRIMEQLISSYEDMTRAEENLMMAYDIDTTRQTQEGVPRHSPAPEEIQEFRRQRDHAASQVAMHKASIHLSKDLDALEELVRFLTGREAPRHEAQMSRSLKRLEYTDNIIKKLGNEIERHLKKMSIQQDTISALRRQDRGGEVARLRQHVQDLVQHNNRATSGIEMTLETLEKLVGQSVKKPKLVELEKQVRQLASELAQSNPRALPPSSQPGTALRLSQSPERPVEPTPSGPATAVPTAPMFTFGSSAPAGVGTGQVAATTAQPEGGCGDCPQKLEAARREIEKLKQQIQTLNNAMEAAREEIRSKRDDLAKALEDASQLNKVKREYATDRGSWILAGDTHKKEIGSLKQQLDEANARLDEINPADANELEELRVFKERHTQTIKCELTLKKNKKTIAHLEGRVADLGKKTGSGDCPQKLAKAQMDLVEAESKLKAVKEKLVRYANLEVEIKAVHDSNATLEKTVERQEEQMKGLDKKRLDLEAEKTARAMSDMSLNADAQDSQVKQAIQDVKDDNASKAKLLEVHETHISKLEGDVQNLQQEIEAVRDAHRNCSGCKEKSGRIDQLERQLNDNAANLASRRPQTPRNVHPSEPLVEAELAKLNKEHALVMVEVDRALGELANLEAAMLLHFNPQVLAEPAKKSLGRIGSMLKNIRSAPYQNWADLDKLKYEYERAVKDADIWARLSYVVNNFWRQRDAGWHHDVGRLDKSLAEANKSLAEANKSLAEANEERNKVQAQHDAFIAESRRKTDELTANLNSARDLSQKLDSGDDAQTALKAAIGEIQSKLDSQAAEAENLRRDLQKKDEEIREATEKIQQQQNHLREAAKHQEELEKKLKSVEHGEDHGTIARPEEVQENSNPAARSQGDASTQVSPKRLGSKSLDELEVENKRLVKEKDNLNTKLDKVREDLKIWSENQSRLLQGLDDLNKVVEGRVEERTKEWKGERAQERSQKDNRELMREAQLEIPPEVPPKVPQESIKKTKAVLNQTRAGLQAIEQDSIAQRELIKSVLAGVDELQADEMDSESDSGSSSDPEEILNSFEGETKSDKLRNLIETVERLRLQNQELNDPAQRKQRQVRDFNAQLDDEKRKNELLEAQLKDADDDGLFSRWQTTKREVEKLRDISDRFHELLKELKASHTWAANHAGIPEGKYPGGDKVVLPLVKGLCEKIKNASSVQDQPSADGASIPEELADQPSTPEAEAPTREGPADLSPGTWASAVLVGRIEHEQEVGALEKMARTLADEKAEEFRAIADKKCRAILDNTQKLIDKFEKIREEHKKDVAEHQSVLEQARKESANTEGDKEATDSAETASSETPRADADSIRNDLEDLLETLRAEKKAMEEELEKSHQKIKALEKDTKTTQDTTKVDDTDKEQGVQEPLSTPGELSAESRPPSSGGATLIGSTEDLQTSRTTGRCSGHHDGWDLLHALLRIALMTLGINASAVGSGINWLFVLVTLPVAFGVWLFSMSTYGVRRLSGGADLLERPRMAGFTFPRLSSVQRCLLLTHLIVALTVYVAFKSWAASTGMLALTLEANGYSRAYYAEIMSQGVPWMFGFPVLDERFWMGWRVVSSDLMGPATWALTESIVWSRMWEHLHRIRGFIA